ncbi:hypothetical protein OVN20_05315 [Microcella daejeonensis]|uniref:hypothetical protein n=1 Tax=Microcella daejeonensis TaxID=2994971 RepID=UPI0022713959|nr:hypothetical protein [Microcella daejeonensis]WAB84971.1 hypothetical protein OVN20_05315 [Microcella daejeonensis]
MWEGDDPAVTADGHWAGLQAALTQALIRQAALEVIEQLQADIDHFASDPESIVRDDLEVLRRLPGPATGGDLAQHGRRMLVVFQAAAFKLTQSRAAPSTMAEYFALHLILDHTELLNDLYEVGLASGWRERLERALLVDASAVKGFSDVVPEGFDIYEPIALWGYLAAVG